VSLFLVLVLCCPASLQAISGNINRKDVHVVGRRDGSTETLHEDDEAPETDVMIGHIRAIFRSKVAVQRLLSV
jgi:hypothetical protein